MKWTRRPELELDPKLALLVHQALGFALWHVQQFEEVLAVYLAISFELEPGVGEQQAEAVLSGFEKKTLGRLIADLRRHEDISPGLSDDLQHFLQERNWLVHRSRRENHTDLYDGQKAAELVNRVEEIGDEGLRLTTRFASVLEALVMERTGMSREELEAEAILQLQKWKALAKEPENDT
jgi:hypothetical protein